MLLVYDHSKSLFVHFKNTRKRMKLRIHENSQGWHINKNHSSSQCRQKRLQLGRVMLPHRPYSPDIDPSNMKGLCRHSFQSLQKKIDSTLITKRPSNLEDKYFELYFTISKDRNL